jgi:plastocyanin
MVMLSYRPGKKIRFPTLRAALPFLLIALSAAFFLGCGGATRNPDPQMAPVAEHGNVPAAMHQGQAKDEAPPTEPNQVVIDNFRFSPRKLTVPAGTKVTWVNRDDVPHTATSTAKPRVFDSKSLDTDDQFAHTFATPGTYEYFCAVHPHMTGQIVVK